MKKLYTLLTAAIITASAYAQAPNKMTYQAVVRDSGNVLITSTSVGMQLSILQGSVSGPSVYRETQTPTTNINGLVSIEIGSGTVVSGAFTTIDWSAGPYFIKTETDPAGGTNYTITGTSQLMSVPYSLHANTADSIVGGVSITETDPVFGASIAIGITALDTSRWNTTTQLDSSGVSALGFVAGPHTLDTDTQLDSAGISGLGYFAGGHTVDTDTQIDSIGISSLGYVAGAHTINTDTQLDSAGISSLGYFAGDHTVDTDTQIDSVGISSLGYLAGPHTDSTAIADMGFVTKSTCGLAIGDTISGGGIIFYLDPSGCHGLVCASTDQSSGIKWNNGTPATTYAFGNGIGAGVGNTSTILTHQGFCTLCYASLTCYNVLINGYLDWYLPSRYELKLMYQNIGQGNSLGLGNIGGFNASTYWSSTEHGPNNVWFTNFATGVSNGDLKSRLYRVRAVRAF